MTRDLPVAAAGVAASAVIDGAPSRRSRYVGQGIFLVVLATLLGCSQRNDTALAGASPSPPPGLTGIQRRCWGGGNDGVRLWRCSTEAERRAATAGVIAWQEHYGRRDIRVISRDKHDYPIEVMDVRSGVRGAVDYEGAVVVSTDNTNGWLIVPLIGSDNHWSIIVWKMQGEFDLYRGLRRL